MSSARKLLISATLIIWLASPTHAFIIGDLLSALGGSASNSIPDGFRVMDAPGGKSDGEPTEIVLSVVSNGDNGEAGPPMSDPVLLGNPSTAEPFYAQQPTSVEAKPEVVKEQEKPEAVLTPDPTLTIQQDTTTPAPIVINVPSESEKQKLRAEEEAKKKKEHRNMKCYDKYPMVICENYRLFGYCESLKSRLAYYCERSCGLCTDECFNEEPKCTQTENHCQAEITHIPNEKCQALCGGCEVKLTQEHHQKLEEHKFNNQNSGERVEKKDKDKSSSSTASTSWPFDDSDQWDMTLEA